MVDEEKEISEKMDDGQASTEKAKAKKKGCRGFIACVIVAVALVLVVFYYTTFVLFPVVIVGDSMKPTLDSGDIVLANSKASPEAGDIIVIKDEKADAFIIKRVIAVEGQTVEIKDGAVYVDGVKLEEDYVSSSTSDPFDNWQYRVIGEGELFYLGDNRINSKDSRYPEYDTCKVEQVVGVVPKWAVSIKKVTSFIF